MLLRRTVVLLLARGRYRLRPSQVGVDRRVPLRRQRAWTWAKRALVGRKLEILAEWDRPSHGSEYPAFFFVHVLSLARSF